MQQSIQPEIEKWLVQMRKGAAEFAILSLLTNGRSYGSKLLDNIAEAKRLNLSEGSIYPLLKRLEQDQKITSFWQQDEGAAHPRKYYELTAKGRSLVTAMSREWDAFCRAMDTLQAPLDRTSLSEAS